MFFYILSPICIIIKHTCPKSELYPDSLTIYTLNFAKPPVHLANSTNNKLSVAI